MPPHGYSHELFIAFTRDIWLAIGNSIVRKPLLPDPQTLEDVMRAWSVNALSNFLGEDKTHFLLFTHALKGELSK